MHFLILLYMYNDSKDILPFYQKFLIYNLLKGFCGFLLRNVNVMPVVLVMPLILVINIQLC